MVIVVFTSEIDEGNLFIEALGEDWNNFLEGRRMFFRSDPFNRTLETIPDEFDLMLVWEPVKGEGYSQHVVEEYAEFLNSLSKEINRGGQQVNVNNVLIILHGNSSKLHNGQRQFAQALFNNAEMNEAMYSHEIINDLYSNIAQALGGDNG